MPFSESCSGPILSGTLHDCIHAMHNGLVTRGAQTVATTTTATWAQELVTVGIGDFFDLLQPVSIYATTGALGGRFTFGPNGIVSIPYRTSTATVGGAFVAQGGNIPVKKASFNAINLTPKKVGVISTFTREIAEHSTPSIEALLREAIVNDTATAIDSTLMDNTAATTTGRRDCRTMLARPRRQPHPVPISPGRSAI